MAATVGMPRAQARCSAVEPAHIQLLVARARPPAICESSDAPARISARTCTARGSASHIEHNGRDWCA